MSSATGTTVDREFVSIELNEMSENRSRSRPPNRATWDRYGADADNRIPSVRAATILVLYDFQIEPRSAVYCTSPEVMKSPEVENPIIVQMGPKRVRRVVARVTARRKGRPNPILNYGED